MVERQATEILQNTTAKRVKEELAAVTGLQQWNDSAYWSFFLKGRTAILDDLFKEIEDKDWLNPSTAKRVEELFITRAKDRWQGNDKWALEGGWLDTRPDIVTWLRWTYWKHNQKRVKAEGSESRVVHWLMCVADYVGVGSRQQTPREEDVGATEVQPEGGESNKSWKKVVGLDP